jgi:hypothetical protein
MLEECGAGMQASGGRYSRSVELERVPGPRTVYTYIQRQSGIAVGAMTCVDVSVCRPKRVCVAVGHVKPIRDTRPGWIAIIRGSPVCFQGFDLKAKRS